MNRSSVDAKPRRADARYLAKERRGLTNASTGARESSFTSLPELSPRPVILGVRPTDVGRAKETDF
jgi:hypothetical protein